jgi:hypothetical protein
VFNNFVRKGNDVVTLLRDLIELQETIKKTEIGIKTLLETKAGTVNVVLTFQFLDDNGKNKGYFTADVSQAAACGFCLKMLNQDLDELRQKEAELKLELKQKL